MLRIIENKYLCDKRSVDGMYVVGFEEIVVHDRNDRSVLVHEISHYLWDKGSVDYLDAVLGISKVLGVTFWEVVNVEAVSEMVDDYEVLIDELCAYFVEQVYEDFPELVLDSVPIYRNVIQK